MANPFDDITKGTELDAANKVAATSPQATKDDPFGDVNYNVPNTPAANDNSEGAKGGFLENLMNAKLFSGTKEIAQQQQEGKLGYLESGGKILKQEASNAWNLIEGNQFANDARIFTGTSSYNINIDTITSELNDTNAKMSTLVKEKEAGRPFDQRYYLELGKRQSMYSTELQAVADDATKKSDTWNNLKTGLSSEAKTLIDNPIGGTGQLAGGMLDSLFQDPELAMLGGASTAIKRITAANGIAAKAANLGIDLANNKFARGSLHGAAMIAPIDMAQQLNETNMVNYGQTGTSLVSGMLVGVLAKGIFNDSTLGKTNVAARNAVLKATGSGKESLANVVRDVTGDADSAAVEAAQGAGKVGGDYSVDTLIPETIKMATKKAYAEIEEMSKEPVSTKGIVVSEASDEGLLRRSNAVMDNRINGVTDDTKQPSLKGYSVSEQAPDETVTLEEPPAKRTFRSFRTDVTGYEPAVMNITGNKFAADIKDDDGFKMGEVRGFVNGSIVQPIINVAAERDRVAYPNAVFNAWEQLTKYSLQTGRTFSSFINADFGAMDWLGDMRAKGYKVVENQNRAFDWSIGSWKSLDGKPLFSIVGHETGAGAPEMVEAKTQLQEAQNDFMAGQQTGRNYQEGKVSLKTLLPMALFGMGFAYGYSKQQSIMQGFKDGAVATALTLVPSALAMIRPAAAGVMEGLKGVGKEHFELGAFGEKFNNQIQSLIPYRAYVFKNSINAILGATENHHATFMALHGDKAAEANLTPNERTVFTAVRSVNDQLGKIGKAAGILDDAMNEFFSRWMRPGPNAPKIAKENWGKYRPWQERKYPAGIDGMKKLMEDGYEPVTENIGEIMQNYMTSMYRAIELNKFTEAAKQYKFEDGTQAVLPANKAPKDYIPLTGTLHGMSGHPDVARDFNFLLDFPKFGAYGKAYDFVNYGMKRGQLNLALFHPGQLAKNYTFANVGSAITDVDPARLGGLVKGIANAVNPNSEIRNMIKSGHPTVQDALDHGMTLSLGHTTEDFASDSFYGSLDKMSEFLDKQPLGSGQAAKTLVDAYGKLSKLNDKVAFEMIQNYFKMDTFMREVQKQTQVGWNNHLRQPDRFAEPDTDTIKKDVASYVNNLYGSENYYQIVQDSNNWFMKVLKNETFNPSMRRKLLQRTEYAPDWTLSVIRSVSQAIPGLSDNALAGQLHRRFVLGLAAMTFTAANVVNYHYSGKYIWQNQNPGYIDLGNGYRMQWDKQLSELTDMVTDLPKWSLNRMAAFPRYGFEVMTNQQYVSKYRAPPIVPKGDTGMAALGDEAAHLGAQWLPISGHQALETQSGRAEFNKQGALNAASSMLAFPIYKNPGTGAGKGSSKSYNPDYVRELLKQYKPKKR